MKVQQEYRQKVSSQDYSKAFENLSKKWADIKKKFLAYLRFLGQRSKGLIYPILFDLEAPGWEKQIVDAVTVFF